MVAVTAIVLCHDLIFIRLRKSILCVYVSCLLLRKDTFARQSTEKVGAMDLLCGTCELWCLMCWDNLGTGVWLFGTWM